MNVDGDSDEESSEHEPAELPGTNPPFSLTSPPLLFFPPHPDALFLSVQHHVLLSHYGRLSFARFFSLDVADVECAT
eukprot:1833960-Rhodomonas_salina.1